MILRYISVLGDAPEVFIILIAAFSFSMLVGLTLHEFSHAIVADSLGDYTPRMLGRLSLNPKAHLDLLGSSLIFFVGFGWAKPVPVNVASTLNPKRSMALISLAGPISNLIIAGLAALPIKLGIIPFWHPFVDPSFAMEWASIWTSSPQDLIGLFLGTVVLLNILLAIFNLLPIAPLDGFNAALGLLPVAWSVKLAKTATWGPGILMLLILLPYVTGGQSSPLFLIMSPLISFFLNLFVGGDAFSLFG
ncbi:MAG: site-2 protease family protein [Chloroflexi bacterium]|nr:site-2 protease family protein [Chloroflexota bacterium]|tara:strand:+ start:4514 stop:5257 length:744 start_codon:yes stop_codon:yes gene_type:complete